MQRTTCARVLDPLWAGCDCPASRQGAEQNPRAMDPARGHRSRAVARLQRRSARQVRVRLILAAGRCGSSAAQQVRARQRRCPSISRGRVDATDAGPTRWGHWNTATDAAPAHTSMGSAGIPHPEGPRRGRHGNRSQGRERLPHLCQTAPLVGLTGMSVIMDAERK